MPGMAVPETDLYFSCLYFSKFEQNELNKTQQELKKGSEKLEDMLKKLEKEQVLNFIKFE